MQQDLEKEKRAMMLLNFTGPRGVARLRLASIAASVRVVRTNLVPMAAWGLTITAGLVLGSIPIFLGLVVVLPVLGHATWHLYRKVITD